MSLWHLRSMTATSVFDTPKACQQTVQFYDDMVRYGPTFCYCISNFLLFFCDQLNGCTFFHFIFLWNSLKINTRSGHLVTECI